MRQVSAGIWGQLGEESKSEALLRTVALETLVLSHAVTAFPVVLFVDLINQHLRCF